jgi:hypothetical protein
MTYAVLVQQFSRVLGNLDGWLAKAAEHATSRGFSPDAFLATRLAPDMLPFARQVQIACDAAKAAAAQVSGEAAPRFPDDETTLAALRERIAKTRAFIDALKFDSPVAQDGARRVLVGFPPDKKLSLHDYITLRQVPNFHFHLVTAYALLRQGGVVLGKADYLGPLPLE